MKSFLVILLLLSLAKLVLTQQDTAIPMDQEPSIQDLILAALPENCSGQELFLLGRCQVDEAFGWSAVTTPQMNPSPFAISSRVIQNIDLSRLNQFFFVLVPDDQGLIPLISSTNVGHQCIQKIIDQVPSGLYKLKFQTFIPPLVQQISELITIKLQLIRDEKTETIEIPVLLTEKIEEFFEHPITIPKTQQSVKISLCNTQVQNSWGVWIRQIQLLKESNLPTQPIANCMTQVTIRDSSICIACIYGYIRGFQSDIQCIKQVPFCSVYQSGSTGICRICISGYVLSRNMCYKVPDQCLKTDLAGKCIDCISGYQLSNGLCKASTSSMICGQGQYKSTQGICVVGTTANCKTYESQADICLQCKEGHEFNPSFKCRPSRINCPDKNETTKFILQGFVCVPMDIHCILMNADGSCPVCQQGFYSQNGICIKAKLTDGELQSIVSNREYFVDDFGDTYYIDENGLRIYGSMLQDQGGNLQRN